jgi:hypothetical protein
MTNFPTTAPALKPFFESIGELCNEWAHLEGWINRLFLSVGAWDYRLPMSLQMSGSLSLRDQLGAVRLGVIIRCTPGPFLDRILLSLDYVDNELRVSRNSFIHHIWATAEDGVGAMKFDITARAKTRKGSGIREVQYGEILYLSLEEVREVIDDIVNERHYISKIVQCFQNPQDEELPRLLAELPPRLHLLRLRERQRQKDISGAKQKPQPKSSRRES